MSESKAQYFQNYRERMADAEDVPQDIRIFFICALNAAEKVITAEEAIFRVGDPQGPDRDKTGVPKNMRYRRCVSVLANGQDAYGPMYRFTIHFDYPNQTMVFQCHGHKLQNPPHLLMSATTTEEDAVNFIKGHLDYLDTVVYGDFKRKMDNAHPQ